MADVITPNMSLTVPTTGGTLGPTYANEINGDLTLLDQHDHSAGKGVPVTPAGLSITSDLSFQDNNATTLRSVRLSIQDAPLALGSDLNCLYDVSGDLYFNDGVGNQIQITSSGGVNSGNGNITNLLPPAALTYVSATPAFVATSSPTVPANFDGGSLTIRKVTANSNGVTLTAPASLPANYSLTFPSALPASQKIASIDNSGNIAANYVVDNSTIEIATNTIQVKDGGITSAKLASGAAIANIASNSLVLQKIAATFNTTTVTGSAAGGAGATTVMSLLFTPNTSRGVEIALANGLITFNKGAVGIAFAQVEFLKNGVSVVTYTIEIDVNTLKFILPTSMIRFIDTTPTAGVGATYALNLYCLEFTPSGASVDISGIAVVRELL